MFSHLSSQCFILGGMAHMLVQGALLGNPMDRVPLAASPTGHEHVNLSLSPTTLTRKNFFLISHLTFSNGGKKAGAAGPSGYAVLQRALRGRPKSTGGPR